MIITKGDPTEGANWSYKLVTQLVVLTGIFITSILIGLLSSTFQNKFNKLQEGTSEVVEKNHTIIIGWTGQTITILRELIEANLSQKNPPKRFLDPPQALAIATISTKRNSM